VVGSLEERQNLGDAVDRLKKAKEGERADEIRKAAEGLNQGLHDVSKRLYEAASGAGGPTPGAAPEKPAGENVVDAEFRTKPEDRNPTHTEGFRQSINFFRPYGTYEHSEPTYPAMNRWAIFRRPFGTEGGVLESQFLRNEPMRAACHGWLNE